MPILQIRDLPEDVYQAVVAAAALEQRSLAQQAIVELRRALSVGTETQRARLVKQLNSSDRRLPNSALSPELLQREDRDS